MSILVKVILEFLIRLANIQETQTNCEYRLNDSRCLFEVSLSIG